MPSTISGELGTQAVVVYDKVGLLLHPTIVLAIFCSCTEQQYIFLLVTFLAWVILPYSTHFSVSPNLTTTKLCQALLLLASPKWKLL